MSTKTFMRFARGPNERRTISREDVGFYNALIIAGLYEVGSEDVDIHSAQLYIRPLKHCIEKHSFLGVVVNDKHTEQPAFEAVSTIDLHDHLANSQDHGTGLEGELNFFKKVLPPILDRPWPANIPPWRIVVLSLTAPPDCTIKRCLVAFSFSHTLGDGMSAIAFHRNFLEGWRLATSTDQKGSLSVSPPSRLLPEPFDTPDKLPISWNFLLSPLLAVHLPHFLSEMIGLRATASTVDAGTWIGSPIFFKPPPAPPSRLRTLEINAPLVQTALHVSRHHDTKLTATMHQFIIRALSKAIPDPSMVSGTAVDMRRSIGTPSEKWGLFVSAHYEIHPRCLGVAGPTLSDEMWAAASSMTKKLAECGTRLHAAKL
ncbi:hypothetical protein ACN38_g11455 [Penicillium nordicum]|uniref:Alcohol acetyltransferase n=1 Tax=Penicillium nordicum TaxID=229535 RepID=A0A0M8NR71_9EURO|nr:hypothetical protein ACN38_g11455 [Penicillium nordicum]